MLLRLCQLKSLTPVLMTLLILSSCSSRKDEVQTNNVLLSTFPHGWYKTNSEHSLVGTDDRPLSHLLIDVTPEFKPADHFVNVVVAVPEGSQHSYQIDPYSGQRFYNHTYCKQKDIWNAYTGSVEKPSFYAGYIPRVLDQLGGQQKIIVWSQRKAFKDSALTNFHHVKILGAYVEQNCSEGNCLGKNNWLSRLVFIGVDVDDKELSSLSDLELFKKQVDWDKAKATLENMDGQNFIGDHTYPHTRVGELISYDEAFNFFKKRSIFLTDTELKKIQKSCHAIYDKLWDEVGRERPEDKKATTKQESEAKRKLLAQLKKDKKAAGFAERFRTFTRKYYNEFSTCEKFVYHGNFNKNPEKFWFLAMMDIFYRLHKEGYYFDCVTRTWQRNIIDDTGSLVHDLKRDINRCSEKEIDRAMSFLPNFLNGLKGEKEYFRFIDYDTHTFGSHSKMYSWVKVSALHFDCSNDPNVEIRKKLKVFPEDISWKERFVQDYDEKEKIIR